MIRPTNPRRQNLRPMIRFLPRLWGMDDSVNGRIVPNNRAHFLFPSREAMDTVTRRGPWSFNEWMVAMGTWDGDLPIEYPNHVQFWIQIRDIPIQFYIYSIVNHIASTLVDIAETDFNLDAATNREFARFRVNWPLNQPLVFNRRFRFGSHNEVPITFRYERLRNYCFRCRSLCHDVMKCEEPEHNYHMNPPGDDGPDDDLPNQMTVIETVPQAASRRTISSSTAIEAPPSPILLEHSHDGAHTQTNFIPDFVSLNEHRISPSLLIAVYET